MQGSHPTTRALFQAADTGGYDDLDGLASEDFRAYANGYSMFAEEHDQGPESLVGIFDYLRKAVPTDLTAFNVYRAAIGLPILE